MGSQRIGRVASPQRSIEVECKFDAGDDRVWKWLAAGGVMDGYRALPAERQRLISVYLDTHWWSLARAGVALRLRRRAGHPGCEFTAKWAGTVRGATHVRPEETVVLPRWPRLPLRSVPEPLWGLLAGIVAARALEPILITEIERTRFLLHGPRGQRSRLLAELALDQVWMRVPNSGAAHEFREVELELCRGSRRELKRLGNLLQEQFSLLPNRQSKFERGLQLLYRDVPQFVSNPPPRGSQSALLRWLRRWQEADRAVRLGVVGSGDALARVLEGVVNCMVARGHDQTARDFLPLLAQLCGAERGRRRASKLKACARRRHPASASELRVARRLARVLQSRDYFRSIVKLEEIVYGSQVPRVKSSDAE